MTANFDVGFTSPGDYITYDVEVTNSGTLDAVIERINVVTNDNPAIIYTTSGIKRGDVIEHNSKKYLTVKIEYDSATTTQPQTNNNALTIQLFTAQNLGQVETGYQTYSIGDKITFAGSDWYVIKGSTEDEEYVILMKEKVLTNEELGNYSITYNNTEYDTMPYYWNSTCHMIYTIGETTYSDNDDSGCENHNDYERSKVKEFLEENYLPIIDSNSNKLKEIDGYKIRLITRAELNQNLGWTALDKYATDSDNSQIPKWVYRNFGEGQNGVIGYWTMTPSSDINWVLSVDFNGRGQRDYILRYSFGVRPVINLYKSAIE